MKDERLPLELGKMVLQCCKLARGRDRLYPLSTLKALILGVLYFYSQWLTRSMVVPCGHSKLHLEFPRFLNNGANFVVQDNNNHHFTQPLCLSARDFSNIPALSLLLVLTHTVASPSTAISRLQTSLSQVCPFTVIRLKSPTCPGPHRGNQQFPVHLSTVFSC